MHSTGRKTPTISSTNAKGESPPPSAGGAEQVRPFRRKRRAWLFKVERTTNHGITEADLLASVCKRYRTVKKLVVKPDAVAPASSAACAAAPSGEKAAPASDSSFVEITFAGPQPSENCGALLCLLLGGDSVQAWPVELPRGRKRKNAAPSSSSSEEGRTADDPVLEAAANIGPPWSSASEAPRPLPPSPTPREQKSRSWEPQPLFTEDSQPPYLPQPRYPQAFQQHQQFANQAGLFGLNPPFPVAQQPPPEARQVKPADARSRGGHFGVDGASFSAPEGLGSIDSDGGRAPLPMEEVQVVPSRKECDLEGRPFPTTRMTGNGAPIASGPAGDRQCHLVFTGLEETGHDLNSLRVTALFGVDAVHQTATVTSPLQVGVDGRAYSSVFYPSLQEIWPELYDMPNVQAVEVDIEVEILSDSGGEYRYHGPQLKVIYHRAGAPVNAAAAAGESARGYWDRRMPPPRSPTLNGDDEFRPIYSNDCADNHR